MKTKGPTKQFLLVAGLMFLLMAASCPAAILLTAINPANQHRYYLLESSTWTDADAEAVSLGGHLATINDAAENAWLFNTWGNGRSLWIGLTDRTTEDVFVWASGEQATYTNWAGPEPNNGGIGGADEDYAYIYAAGAVNGPGQWNDYQNSSTVSPQPPLHGVVEVACLCPANITTNTAPGQCNNVVTFSFDNCPGNIKSCNPPSGSTFQVGTTVVTCTATDGAGNTNMCTFNVTVRDTEVPRIACPSGVASNLRWEFREPFIDPRSVAPNRGIEGASASLIGDKIYVSHGYRGTDSRNLSIYDIPGDSWIHGGTEAPDAGVTRSELAGGTAFGKHYALGGRTGPTAANEEFDPATRTWRTRASMSVARGGVAAASYQNKIYVLGGRSASSYGGGTIYNVNEEYDPLANSWRTLAPMPLGVSDHYATVALDGKIYVFGGTTGGAHDGDTNRVQIYDIASNTWSNGTPMPTRRGAAMAGVIQGKIAVFGGVIGLGSSHTNVSVTEIYDPVANSWAPGPNMLNASSEIAQGVTFTGNEIYAIGSGISGASRTDVEVLIAAENPLIFTADPGRCSKSNVTFTVTATDNCLANVPVRCLPPSGSNFPAGITTVNCSATDNAGNTNNCAFTVTVRDTQAPQLFCNNLVRTLPPGQCEMIVGYQPDATDNCQQAGGTLVVVCQPSSGSVFPKGTTSVNCTVTDGGGNSTNCAFTIRVVDATPPTLTCPGGNGLMINTEPGQCSAAVAFNVTANDDCSGVVQLTCSPPSGSRFDKGTHTVACMARDGVGNVGTCTFQIVVKDMELPLLSCPADIVTNAPPGQCSAIVNFSTSATDNCPGLTVTCDPPSGSTFSNQTTVVSCRATDAATNIATCFFTITLNGTLTITPPQDVTTCSGQSANFSTLVTGSGPFTFAWKLNGNPTGTNGPTLTVQTGGLAPGAHLVTVMVTSPCGSATNGATLYVGSGSIIASALTNLTRCICESATFMTTVSGGGPARFVWKANGRLLEGETNRMLLLQNLKETNAGLYTLEVSGPCNSVTNSATLTIEGTLQNPLIIDNPASIAINDYPLLASPYPSKINVKCVPGILTNLIVVLRGFSHEFPDDVDIMLVSPAGRGLKLMSDAAGGEPVTGLSLTFNDAATSSLPDEDESLLVSGVFRATDYESNDSLPAPAPSGPYATNLTALTGIVPNGMWSLYVFDDARGDAGSIASGWSLRLSWQPTPPSVSAPMILPDGRFQMMVTSLPGLTYVIEASTDLETWVPIGTNTVSETTFNYIDAEGWNHSRRFYRVIRCP